MLSDLQSKAKGNKPYLTFHCSGKVASAELVTHGCLPNILKTLVYNSFVDRNLRVELPRCGSQRDQRIFQGGKRVNLTEHLASSCRLKQALTKL